MENVKKSPEIRPKPKMEKKRNGNKPLHEKVTVCRNFLAVLRPKPWSGSKGPLGRVREKNRPLAGNMGTRRKSRKKFFSRRSRKISARKKKKGFPGVKEISRHKNPQARAGLPGSLRLQLGIKKKRMKA